MHVFVIIYFFFVKYFRKSDDWLSDVGGTLVNTDTKTYGLIAVHLSTLICIARVKGRNRSPPAIYYFRYMLRGGGGIAGEKEKYIASGIRHGVTLKLISWRNASADARRSERRIFKRILVTRGEDEREERGWWVSKVPGKRAGSKSGRRTFTGVFGRMLNKQLTANKAPCTPRGATWEEGPWIKSRLVA